MQAIKRPSHDVLVAVGLFVIVAIVKINVINTPFYWDEMWAYIQPSHWLANRSLVHAFPGFHPPQTFFGHPFAIYLFLASLYKIFGESIWLSHVFILVVTFIGLFYTYLLGTFIHNKTVGLLAALLMLFNPLFFAQSGMVNGDIVIGSLGVVTVYYFLNNRPLPYLISSTLLVLSKEASVAIIVGIIIYALFVNDSKRRKGQYFFIFAPLIIISVFWTFQAVTSGSLLPNGYFVSHTFFVQTGSELISKFVNVLRWALTSQYKILLSVLILINFILNFEKAFKVEYIMFLMFFIFFVGAYSCILFMPRYILPVFPYFFIISAASITSLFDSKKLYVLTTFSILLCFASILCAEGNAYGTSETDMQYLDTVMVHKSACSYIESRMQGKLILTNSPLSEDLTSPFLGYVNKPVKVTHSPNDNYDVLVYSKQSDIDSVKNLEAVITEKKMNLIKKFMKNGKEVDIFMKVQNLEVTE